MQEPLKALPELCLLSFQHLLQRIFIAVLKLLKSLIHLPMRCGGLRALVVFICKAITTQQLPPA